jgi:hypothetical protein
LDTRKAPLATLFQNFLAVWDLNSEPVLPLLLEPSPPPLSGILLYFKR